MNRRILITGASGFIGRHLCRSLAEGGDEVIACGTESEAAEEGSVAPPWPRYALRLPDDRFDAVVRSARAEFLVHCAGSSSVQNSFQDPARDFEENVLVTEFVLDTLARLSPETRVVFLSSAAVYGEQERLPIDEKATPNPMSPYASHKLMGEMICARYLQSAGVPVSVLRVFSAYGPGLRQQILWDIFQQFHGASAITLGGSGAETRDFIHVDDLVRVIDLVLQRGRFDATPVNVGCGTPIAIRQLGHLMIDALGGCRDLRFSYEPRRGDPRHLEANIETLQALGIRSWVPIGTGLRQYVGWLRSQSGGAS